jgi:hypothetical protein
LGPFWKNPEKAKNGQKWQKTPFFTPYQRLINVTEAKKRLF